MPTSRDTTADVQRPDAHLTVEGIAAGYGGNLVVRDVSIQVGRGEVATILGPNGSGKSTVLKAFTGQITVERGRVSLGDQDVTNRRSETLARLGIGYVPQENDVFAPLTVEENLLMGGYLLRRTPLHRRVGEIMEMFPVLGRLRGSAAGRLSGGERKLLAMGRVLMLAPTVLVLDEPTANLSPQATREVLVDHVRVLADAGTSVVLVEQKALQALEIADWAYVMVAGAVLHSSSAAALAERQDVGQMFLGKPPVVAT